MFLRAGLALMTVTNHKEMLGNLLAQHVIVRLSKKNLRPHVSIVVVPKLASQVALQQMVSRAKLSGSFKPSYSTRCAKLSVTQKMLGRVLPKKCAAFMMAMPKSGPYGVQLPPKKEINYKKMVSTYSLSPTF